MNAMCNVVNPIKSIKKGKSNYSPSFIRDKLFSTSKIGGFYRGLPHETPNPPNVGLGSAQLLRFEALQLLGNSSLSLSLSLPGFGKDALRPSMKEFRSALMMQNSASDPQMYNFPPRKIADLHYPFFWTGETPNLWAGITEQLSR